MDTSPTWFTYSKDCAAEPAYKFTPKSLWWELFAQSGHHYREIVLRMCSVSGIGPIFIPCMYFFTVWCNHLLVSCSLWNLFLQQIRDLGIQPNEGHLNAGHIRLENPL